MSVVGFDVGNDNCVVGVTRQRGIDIVLNDESKRETPAMVSFSEKQRFLGTAAAASATMNPRNTVSQIKRLLGKTFSDPDLQRDLSILPFSVSESPDGSGNPLVHAHYLGESKSFTPTQILGMILSDLKSIASKNLGISVSDCVIGVPAYLTQVQRRAYLDAAAIAQLQPLKLLHETTAIALAYGFYKTDLPESDPINVVFVDLGHSSMQVCVAAFQKGQMKILAYSFDQSLGGRDFDESLFSHFSKTFKDEYKIDVPSNARASHRLRTACEKLKKVLSANAEAVINIECLMDEKDVRGRMKRDDFEELVKPILERVLAPCEKALKEANISVEQIHSVEVVGSGSRVPSVLRILSSVFQKEPKRSLNASECIAQGCALYCAMLSPTFRVKEFKIQDSFPHMVCLARKGSVAESEESGAQGQASNVVFVKGNSIPSTKLLTFYRSSTFTIDVLYADLPPGANPKIGTFTIGPFQPTKSEVAKLKVKIHLNLHGIVTVESATLIEEEEVSVPVVETKEDGSKDAAKMEIDAAEMDSTVNSKVSEQSQPSGSPENGGESMEQKPASMATEAPKETTKKKKTRKLDVPVMEAIEGALPSVELQKAIENEFKMAQQDRIMEETKDRKNAVEAYLYDMRNKMSDRYNEYAAEVEREELLAKLQETEDWLYEDGEDETKGVYIAKLEELKKLGDPIEARFKEEEARGPALAELQYCIRSFRDAALSSETKYDHIDSVEKEKVINECNKAEEYIEGMIQQQNKLVKSANPVLFVADIRKKSEMLHRYCKPIMTKPPPAAPPKSPTQTPPDAKEGSTESNTTGDSQTETEPMETDFKQEGDTMQTD